MLLLNIICTTKIKDLNYLLNQDINDIFLYEKNLQNISKYILVHYGYRMSNFSTIRIEYNLTELYNELLLSADISNL